MGEKNKYMQEELIEALEKEVDSLKRELSDCEDVIYDQKRKIEELEGIISGVRSLIYDINRIL